MADEQRLYRMRYRAGRSGVIEGFLLVPVMHDEEIERQVAEAIGRAYCVLEPNRAFIRAECAIIGDERLLPAGALEQLRALDQQRTKAAKKSAPAA